MSRINYQITDSQTVVLDVREKDRTFLDVKSNDKRFIGEQLVSKKFNEEKIKLERPYRPIVLLKTQNEFKRFARHYSRLCRWNGIETKLIAEDIYVWEDTNEALELCYDRQEQIYGTQVLPDYIAINTNIMIEIKTGKYARLEKNQRQEFPKIIEKGFRIFIIRPQLSIREKEIQVTGYKCSEFKSNKKDILKLQPSVVGKEIETAFEKSGELKDYKIDDTISIDDILQICKK